MEMWSSIVLRCIVLSRCVSYVNQFYCVVLRCARCIVEWHAAKSMSNEVALKTQIDSNSWIITQVLDTLAQ